jgi:hypothetical protein
MIDERLNREDPGAEVEEINFAVRKRRVVWMLLAYSAILGVIMYFLPDEETPGDFIIGLPILILGIWWCYIDAEERGDRIGGLLRWVLVLLFFVGFPVYVFRSRGVRGYATIGFTLLLAGAMAICMFSTAFQTLFLGYQFGF